MKVLNGDDHQPLDVLEGIHDHEGELSSVVDVDRGVGDDSEDGLAGVDAEEEGALGGEDVVGVRVRVMPGN